MRRHMKGMALIWLCVVVLSPVCLGSNPFGWTDGSLMVKSKHNIALCYEDPDNCPIPDSDPLYKTAFRIRNGDFQELFEMWTWKGTSRRAFIKSKQGSPTIGSIYQTDYAAYHWNFKFYPLFNEDRYIYVQNGNAPRMYYDLWSRTTPTNPFTSPKYGDTDENYQFLYKRWLIIDKNRALDTNIIYEKVLSKCPGEEGSCGVPRLVIPVNTIEDALAGEVSAKSIEYIKNTCFGQGRYCTMNMDSDGQEVVSEENLQVVMYYKGATVIFRPVDDSANRPPYYVLRCDGNFFYFPKNIMTPANDDPNFRSKVEPDRDLVFPIFTDGDKFKEYCAIVSNLVTRKFEPDDKFIPYDSEVLAEQYFYDSPEYIVPDIYIKKEAKKDTVAKLSSAPRAFIRVTLLFGMLVIAAAFMLV